MPLSAPSRPPTAKSGASAFRIRLGAFPGRGGLCAALFYAGSALSLCAASVAGAKAAQASKAAPATHALEAEALPLLREYCYDCHGEGSKKGGVALDKLGKNPAEDQKVWLSVWRNLDAQLMPPSDKPRPSAEQRALLERWVEQGALKLDPANPDPGRVTIRRLNREEYRNTVRDLTGVDFVVQDHFPADDTGYGFDVIGDVLNLSPLHLEKYLSAARTIVDNAFSAAGSLRKPLLPEGPVAPGPQARAEYERGMIRSLSERILRRPVDEPTLEKLCALAAAEDSPEEGVKQAVNVLLASPRFLFRAEVQPEPNNAGKIVPIDEYALASRLSYFLWSSTPDWELLDLARRNQLRANLRPQIERMLKDVRSNRLARNFVGQWLQTRDVETVPIQPRVILGVKKGDEGEKAFSARLRELMRQESEMLFLHVLKEQRPAEELFTARYAFLNQQLAAFYDIRGVKHKDLQKVDLPADSRRQGILTQGTFLVVTSNPTRTSPVKRGQFVLENLLGAPAPPPPPNIPPLEATTKGTRKSMRELMELHRADALCASCHARMDPIGLALENFNAMGQYRDELDHGPLDTSGQLVTGEKFNNVTELIELLGTSRKHDFYRCLSEKLLTYAIGRGLEAYDIPTINRLVAAMEADGGKLSTLLNAAIESAPFQMRRGG